MSALLDATLAHLAALVAFDSTNPPRRPDALVEWLTTLLGQAGLAVALEDHGDGCVAVRATRGDARVLFNAHVDTVPVAPGWTRDPFALGLAERAGGEGASAAAAERIAFGLGAADVKGGAAAMLAAALATDAPCALLFTTDEEAGRAVCMTHEAERLAAHARGHAGVLPHALALVAEPTRARAVVAHRGVATGILRFAGTAAHSSTAGAASAVHGLGRWMVTALDAAARADRDVGPSGLAGLRLNVGRIEGGTKPNVVAGAAEARFGVRPPPERDARAVVRELAALAPLGAGAELEPAFHGPALPSSPELGARAAALAARLGLPCAPAVDFWTEASMLSAVGLPALVLGPGDIAQAHGPDEWVRVAELEAAARLYLAVLEAAPALDLATVDRSPRGGAS